MTHGCSAKGMTTMVASAILALPAFAGAEPPKADGAQFGSLYDLGVPAEATWSGNWNVLHTGDEWDIGGATNSSSLDGPRWWVDWDVCAVPGANIVQVRWNAGRSGPSTSPRHAFRVTDSGATIFATSGNLRDDLAGAINPGRRYYAVATSACHTQLRIDQIGGAAAEPSKRYWVTSPHAIVQDTQAPGVSMAVPGVWLPLGTTVLPVSWSTNDNFGGSGIGNQHISIDGLGERAGGWFRQVGDHAADISLDGVADGTYTARVHVDGDGTDGTDAVGTFHLDRTPPHADINPVPIAPGVIRADINIADVGAGSGTRAWSIVAPDNSVLANQSTGDRLSAIDLKRFDGQDINLRVMSIDGAENDSSSESRPVRVDATPPSVSAAGPSGWVAGLTAATPLSLDLGDNRADGIGEVAVTINTAKDGSGSGQELPLLSRGATARGGHSVAAPLPAGIGDGVHRITVVARDPQFPSQLAARAETTVQLDTTSPTLGDPSGWSLSAPTTGAKYTLTLPGLSDSASGINSVRIMASSDTNGLRTPGTFKAVGTAPALQGQGPTTVTVDLTGFREGRHATTVQVADAAGNISEAPGPTIVFDRTAPTVTATVTGGATPKVSWTQTDAIGFGSCLTTIELQGVSTNVAWQPVAEMAGSTVPTTGASAEIPMVGLKAGDYRVRVTACDAAGNKSSATAKLTWKPDGPATAVAGGSAKSDPSAPRYRMTELWIARPGKPRTAVTETNAAQFRMGQQIRLEGVLQQINGKAAATAVTLYDSAGTLAGTTISDATGHFNLNATVARGGIWRVTAQHGDEILGHVKLRVPAGLVQQVNTRTLHLGDKLVITGHLTPGPLAASKLLQLQWRDGSSWRPIANVNADRFGAFHITYRFRRAAGYAVQMRIAVPAERGWPFEPVNGKPFSVKVM